MIKCIVSGSFNSITTKRMKMHIHSYVHKICMENYNITPKTCVHRHIFETGGQHSYRSTIITAFHQNDAQNPISNKKFVGELSVSSKAQIDPTLNHRCSN